MKLSVFVILCLIVLQYETVQCGLVKGFLEKTHETAEKVRNDIRSVLNLNKNDNTVTKAPKKDEGVVKETLTETDKTPELPKENPDESTRRTESTTITSTPPAPTCTTASTNTGKPENVTTTTAAPGNSTTTEQEGRENFVGGCTTGYQRTADGRYKAQKDIKITHLNTNKVVNIFETADANKLVENKTMTEVNDKAIAGKAPLPKIPDRKNDQENDLSVVTPVTVSELPVSLTSTRISTSNVTSTEQEGRDNFDAPCREGYKRTNDGRCEKIFQHDKESY